MRQKYILIISILFITRDVEGQLPMGIYETIGADTSIQCMDAINAYSIWGTELWAGTNKGVFHFTNTDKTFYDSLNSSLPDNNITAIDAGNEGNIWIGTNHGLCRAENSGLNWDCFNTSNSSLPSDSITSIISFSDDSAWIGTKNGLVLYTSLDDTFKLFNTGNSLLPGNHIQCLERYFFIPESYSPKPLYVGTDSGLLIINGSDWKVYNTANSALTNNDIRSIAVGGYFEGNLYTSIATYGGGVIKLEDTTWSFFNTSNQLIKTDSLDLIEDFVGGTITGSKTDSLYLNSDYYPADDFLQVDDDISNPITAVSFNRGNGSWLWIATENEIYRGDFTQGINSVSPAIPNWKATIDGKNLLLYEIPASNDKMVLKIYDVTGRCFFEKQFFNHSSSSCSFDIPELSNQTYIIQLQLSSKIETLKVIKAN
ncbi:MAG: two-component regulator propeller domain-containing protein [Chitinophagales bacterium]